MAKYYGAIGFASTEEVSPGKWVEKIEERMYKGDLLRNNKKTQNQSTINNDVNISNQISIVTDPYLNENLFKIRYAEWMGQKWNISDIDVQYPRLILSLGGKYNGQ